MRVRTIVIIALVVAAVCAELFVFRFHTYLQRTEVQEALPSVSDAPVPTTLVQGSFVDGDPGHSGSGTARIVEQDGTRYLRLENFEVTNGPDLYVYLSDSSAPGSKLESLGTYSSLGELKGNAGNQTYEIPAGVPDSAKTVVIWCKRFGVLFTYAVMR